MKELNYELENDELGKNTLNVIAEADRFNKWMYQTIKPYCSSEVMEIGSGIGNISTFFLQDDFELFLTDIRTDYCYSLKQKFSDYENVIGITAMDLTDKDFDSKFQHHFDKYNTVFALNVIEHIENDQLAIKNCKKLLKSEGKLIILVPAYQGLYNGFDKELGHFRRYTEKSLSKLFTDNNFNIIHSQYFNFIGTLGWFFTGRILKRKMIPGDQMRLYNKLVPIFKVIDKILFNRIGLSTIVVGTK